MYSRYIPPAKPKGTGNEVTGASLPSKVSRCQVHTGIATAQPYNRYIPPPKPAVPSRNHHYFPGSDDTEEQGPLAKKARPSNDDDGALQKKKPMVKKVKGRGKKKLESLEANPVPDPGPPEEVVVESEAHKPVEPLETNAQISDDDLQDPRQEKSNGKPKKKKKASSVAESGPPEEVTVAHKPGESLADRKTAIAKKKKGKTRQPAVADGTPRHEDETDERHKSVLEKKVKSMQRSEQIVAAEVQDETMEDAPEPIKARGLEPLPQPAPVGINLSKPNYEILPPWLAEPIRVSAQVTKPFTALGLSPELGITADISKRLAAKGYKNAFAVQTAVIPMLLPHYCRSKQGDVLVSAATGSGKTLAYIIPMIRDLSQGSRQLTKLRALIILPTRELVKQVKDVAEDVAAAFATRGEHKRVKIAAAVGNQSLQKEQAALSERDERHDPEAYRQCARRRRRREQHGRGEVESGVGEEDHEYSTDDEEKIKIQQGEDNLVTLPDHVIEYKSKIDLLICTPGRLVEHLNFTPGFSLDHVRWLVIDEADKLLGQQYQQWIDMVLPRLHADAIPNARNHRQFNLSAVRKVVLSATMTRDLDLLGGLKLRRPQLVVLEASGGPALEAQRPNLPETLRENALKADPSLKPLFLLDLLQSAHIMGNPHLSVDDATDDTSSSVSDSCSDDSDPEVDEQEPASKQSPTTPPSVLIFTKSNETAVRLSRLLCIMSPKLSLGTLTSTTAYSTRKQTLHDFSSGKIHIIVASDLVSRGIDLPTLDHVINYDVPSSVTSYVHRVGRTARAGRSGHAWTLFTDSEAHWFWKEVASERAVRRTNKVERLRITGEKEEAFDQKRARYEKALAVLGQEAREHGGMRE